MELRIRVGAAVDRSLSEAFRPLVKAAEQARATVEQSAKKTSQARARETQRTSNDEARAYQKAARDIERWEREKARQVERSAAARARANENATRAESRAAERASREKERLAAREQAAAARAAQQRVREERAALKELEREIVRERREQSQAARTSARAATSKDRAHNRFLRENAAAAFSHGGRAAGAALGVGRDVVSGMGVNLSVASHVANGVELEKRAVDLTNAGYMPLTDADRKAGKREGANNKRQSADELTAQMRQVGDAAAFDPNKAMEGLQKFVAKTGDLQSGRDVILDMARYARASGAELDDMVDAAGDVSNALGDVPNKGEAIKDVMRAIAAQGKEGAVEIKDLSTQMAKLGAASSQFSGDRGAVMAQMGAMVQWTRAKGGAASATQAATSISSFTNTFSKGARLDAFKSFGVDLTGGDGKLDLRKIILGSLKAAEDHGGATDRTVFSKNMGKMFMDVQARRSMKGWETTFLEAGGGQAGLEAVAEKFDQLTAATMKETEISESFARSMNTTEAKVQVFNNQMDKTANELKAVLMPALVDLAPKIVAITKAIVDKLDDLTGTKHSRETKEAVETELRATNASGALGAILHSKGASSDDLDETQTEAQAAKKALEDAIVKQQKKVTEGHNRFEIGVATGRFMSDDQIESASKKGTDSATQYLRDKEQLARMKDSLETITRRQDELADRIASKTLRVILVGDTRPPELLSNPVTRTPPPGGKPR